MFQTRRKCFATDSMTPRTGTTSAFTSMADSRLRSDFTCSLDFPDSPLVHAVSDLVEPRVKAGLRIVDITRLAADFAIARSEPYLAYATVRLSMLMCQHFDADIILAAVRREHIPFYKREFLATQLSEARPYPTLVKPLCLFEINFKANQHAIIGRHPFHASSAVERTNLFGPPTGRFWNKRWI